MRSSAARSGGTLIVRPSGSVTWPSSRAERHGVDRDRCSAPGRARDLAGSPVGRLAVGEQDDRGGRPLARRGRRAARRARCAARRPWRSPPSASARRARRARRRGRSSGPAASSGASENATSADAQRLRHAVEERVARPRRARRSRRVGLDVGGRHRAREVGDEHDRGAARSGTATVRCGLASASASAASARSEAARRAGGAASAASPARRRASVESAGKRTA